MLDLLMRHVVVVFFSVAFSSRGRRVHFVHVDPSDKVQDPLSVYHNVSSSSASSEIGKLQSSGGAGVPHPLQSFTMLLFAFNSAAGWQFEATSRCLDQSRWPYCTRHCMGSKVGTCLSGWHSKQIRLQMQLDGEDEDDPDISAEEFSNLQRFFDAAAATASYLVRSPPGFNRKDAIPLAASWSEGYIDSENNVPMDNYIEMANDETRNSWFWEAICRRLHGSKDLVVLEIGTGPFCLLAQMAAQAGARRVYAVEADPSAAENARACVAEAEATNGVPHGVIEVIEGFSTDITLPERADLLVAEIVGNIATAEGIVGTMLDAQQRHLKRPYDPASYIPQRVQTWCAPVSYVMASIANPPYSIQDFADCHDEHPVLRVSCNDVDVQLLSQPQILEDLDLSKPLPPLGIGQSSNLGFVVDANRLAEAEATHREELAVDLISRPGLRCSKTAVAALVHNVAHSLAGLACWPRLILDSPVENEEDELVVESRGARVFAEDELQEEIPPESNWQTIIALLSERPLPISGGDLVNLTFDVKYGGARGDQPTRYELQGELLPAGAGEEQIGQ